MNAYQNKNIFPVARRNYCHKINKNSSAFLQKIPGHHHHFPWLSMTLAVFYDFPGVENGLTKFHDFPWISRRVVTLYLKLAVKFRRVAIHKPITTELTGCHLLSNVLVITLMLVKFRGWFKSLLTAWTRKHACIVVITVGLMYHAVIWLELFFTAVNRDWLLRAATATPGNVPVVVATVICREVTSVARETFSRLDDATFMIDVFFPFNVWRHCFISCTVHVDCASLTWNNDITTNTPHN